MTTSHTTSRTEHGSQPRGIPLRSEVDLHLPRDLTAWRTWNDRFRRFAKASARSLGSPQAFLIAVTVVVVWAASGPYFQFSDTWELVINTATTIVTFLMVFVIQNTQNRDALAMHLKLDELLRAVEGARNSLVDLEHLSDEQLEQLEKEFERVAKAREDTEDPRSNR